MSVHDRIHGGPDADGAAPWDFSTCANAVGPCAMALEAVRAADPSRYPDPACAAVRQALADLHGVDARRVLPAASASEFIQRVTAVTGRLWPGAVGVPRHAYGDYAAAAHAWGRAACVRDSEDAATLRWVADPSSPLGIDDAPPRDVARRATMLNAVYAPLRLSGTSLWSREAQDAVFVLHSPNKALGLTGVRGAYAIAPAHADDDVAACCDALMAAAPSWPLSAHADAMLRSWATDDVQQWVVHSRATLAAWKADLQLDLARRGFDVQSSVTPYFVVRPPRAIDRALLRAHGVAVRDAASFGLPGCWRVSAQRPEARAALMQALDAAGTGRA